MARRPLPMIRRIVSGGQTGVDRAALDTALALQIPCGGWVPKGRLAEDGVIPATYPGLTQTSSEDPAVRTELNVRDSDATLLITHGPPAGGSALSLQAARRLRKPMLHIDLERQSIAAASRRIREWLSELRPAVLNVAGSRHSEDSAVYASTKAVLDRVLSREDSG